MAAAHHHTKIAEFKLVIPSVLEGGGQPWFGGNSIRKFVNDHNLPLRSTSIYI